MADRTLAQAAADLRLTDAQIDADFRRIVQRLNSMVDQVERSATINIPVGVDPTLALEDLGALQALGDDLRITAHVDVEADEALADLSRIERSGQGRGIEVPLSVDATGFQQEVRQAGDAIRPIMEPAAERAGRNVGLAVGNAINRQIQTVLRTGAVVAGGFLASSLIQGFQRFTVIQDSTASLTVALGSAAEAGQTLADVLT